MEKLRPRVVKNVLLSGSQGLDSGLSYPKAHAPHCSASLVSSARSWGTAVLELSVPHSCWHHEVQPAGFLWPQGRTRPALPLLGVSSQRRAWVRPRPFPPWMPGKVRAPGPKGSVSWLEAGAQEVRASRINVTWKSVYK